MSARIIGAARDLIAKATRVASKYGTSTDGKPRDWTEWQDLRDSIASLAAALSTEPGEAEGMVLVLVPREPSREMIRAGSYAVSGLTHTGADCVYRAMLAAYAEPHYLGPEGMERGEDGVLPPGSPYDRGRYDARKAVEKIAARALSERKEGLAE